MRSLLRQLMKANGTKCERLSVLTGKMGAAGLLQHTGHCMVWVAERPPLGRKKDFDATSSGGTPSELAALGQLECFVWEATAAVNACRKPKKEELVHRTSSVWERRQ